MEPRASCVLGQFFTTELSPRPSSAYLMHKRLAPFKSPFGRKSRNSTVLFLDKCLGWWRPHYFFLSESFKSSCFPSKTCPFVLLKSLLPLESHLQSFIGVNPCPTGTDCIQAIL